MDDYNIYSVSLLISEKKKRLHIIYGIRHNNKSYDKPKELSRLLEFSV